MRMKKTISPIVWLIVFVMSLSACRITRPYASPDVRTDELYRLNTLPDTTNMAFVSWRELFTDTVLRSLIEEGIRSNLDLQAAYTRIEQARAFYEQSRLAFFPSVNASAGPTIQRLSEAQTRGFAAPSRLYQLSVNASWEIDIWGRLRSTRRANLASLLQTEWAARAVQSNLVADIANLYFTLLSLDEQMRITQAQVESRRQTVDVMRALKEAAIVTGAAVVQSEANLYAAEVTLPDIRQNIMVNENALSILLGRAPDSIRRTAISVQQTTALLRTGVPAQLLSNRPDVVQSEYAFRNAFELTNVARTNFYPALTITASGGLTNTSLGSFVSGSSLLGSVGAGIVQPIFNQGLNRARLRVALAQQQEALLNFQNSLLNAGREVTNALFSHQTALEKMAVRDGQLLALERSVEYSQELVRYGFANYTEVLQAQQSLLGAQLGRINDRLQQLQSVVNLYSALGGGWRE